MSYVPKRSINKQQAVRHLIHAAIRMIQAEEDPFAIQVLIQSADKLLIDVAKRTGKPILEWRDVIKSGDVDHFIRHYRATYNFFKHADKDYDKTLLVPNMMRLNIVVLAMCIMNYEKLFSSRTQHMTVHLTFALTIFPRNVFMEGNLALKRTALFTARILFKSLADPMLATTVSSLDEEKKDDLIDIGDFYDTPIAEIETRILQ